jgi:hypothetical protein
MDNRRSEEKVAPVESEESKVEEKVDDSHVVINRLFEQQANDQPPQEEESPADRAAREERVRRNHVIDDINDQFVRSTDYRMPRIDFEMGSQLVDHPERVLILRALQEYIINDSNGRVPAITLESVINGEFSAEDAEKLQTAYYYVQAGLININEATQLTNTEVSIIEDFSKYLNADNYQTADSQNLLQRGMQELREYRARPLEEYKIPDNENNNNEDQDQNNEHNRPLR